MFYFVPVGVCTLCIGRNLVIRINFTRKITLTLFYRNVERFTQKGWGPLLVKLLSSFNKTYDVGSDDLVFLFLYDEHSSRPSYRVGTLNGQTTYDLPFVIRRSNMTRINSGVMSVDCKKYSVFH